MAFRTGELDGKLIVIIDDRRLAAAVRSLDYAWQETTNTDEYVSRIVTFVSSLFAGLASGNVQDWSI